MILRPSTLYLVPFLCSMSWVADVASISGGEPTAKKKTDSLSRATNVDFVMTAPLLTRGSNYGLKKKDFTPVEKKAKNDTKSSVFLRFMQVKTFWNSNNGKNKRRRVFEMTLKPMFIVCCLCVLVLIYLLCRAVKIRRNLNTDNHTIQQTELDNMYQNEA